MRVGGRRRKSIVFFISFGACLVAFAIALNVGWILLNWRQVALLVFGIIFFIAIISGLVLNTIFLVREIRRNEQHDGFINAVTHELKTPIASIRLYLETLQTRDVDETRRREFYEIMLADTERLLHTVDQVLLAGRGDSRGHKSSNSIVDLRELARECLELARTRYNLSADVLRYDQEAETNAERALVIGDAYELRAAVSNLIDNAIKYSRESVEIAIEVRTIDERRVEVRVSDKGIGVPRAQLKRIFRRFYRAPGRLVMRVKGTGLGLFIVRSIAKKHGGRAFATSEGEGLGSTFTIQLPRAKV
jgi:two-component system sensor histidine kinase SenX3